MFGRFAKSKKTQITNAEDVQRSYDVQQSRDMLLQTANNTNQCITELAEELANLSLNVSEINSKLFDGVILINSDGIIQSVTAQIDVERSARIYDYLDIDTANTMSSFVSSSEEEAVLSDACLNGRNIDLLMSKNANNILIAVKRSSDISSGDEILSLLDETATGFVMFDTDGKIIKGNQAFYQMLATRDVAEYNNLFEIMTSSSAPKRERFLKILRKKHKVVNFEFECKTGNKPLFFSVNAYLSVTEDGEFISAICRDVTTKRLIEREQNERARWASCVFDQNFFGVVVLDVKHNIKYMNTLAKSMNLMDIIDKLRTQTKLTINATEYTVKHITQNNSEIILLMP